MEKLMEIKVLIDWEKDTVRTKETGTKTPLYEAGHVDRYTASEALREAAYWMLYKASFMERQDGYVGSANIREQAEKMMKEHELPEWLRMDD